VRPPYFPKRHLIKGTVPLSRARAQLGELVRQPEVVGTIDGDRFWLRPRPLPAGLFARLRGEVSESTDGSWVEVVAGVNPLFFTLAGLIVVLVLVWEVGAILAVQLEASGVVKGAHHELPYFGGAALILLTAGLVWTAIEGRSASKRMLEMIGGAVGAGGVSLSENQARNVRK
jgi:hypothetical protein